jgi:quercetin dioxygenase-like cupin family protein
MDEKFSERRRSHPTDRFAGPVHSFQLETSAQQLREEVRTSGSGHRQQSLYKHGPTSLALFVFGAGTGLAPHRTKGTVIIHVLKGRMEVKADGHVHDLGPGGVVVLAAGVEHEVAAKEETEMLLTVQLNAATAPSP